MRISELAEATGVPVHTLKFYLREGVLMPGTATSRTRAEYGPEHVERVRLVRGLVEYGGVSVEGVRSIVRALESPPPSRPELLGVAHATLPAGPTRGEVSAEVAALVDDLGWQVWHEGPPVAELSSALEAARGAGVPVSPEALRRYARAMEAVAEVDVDVAAAAASPTEALHTVVVGTVMVDPVLVALRRMAQEAVSVARG
ncbi:MerR family transcriptional regulator [Nostocoides sp. Soil756]|uniref:MerR family transcriptional regulator n=1 Tax=Nostocoides sp. Soil756 TaxID=1736399 RepID=UPI0006FEF63D|nr:MerR family transcriptional regulator [Tetrasphaera sp. Soil756]KRE61706.1 hypothetical protein ASG78_10225 [Tetrasphaera sp. Soil756]